MPAASDVQITETTSDLSRFLLGLSGNDFHTRDVALADGEFQGFKAAFPKQTKQASACEDVIVLQLLPVGVVPFPVQGSPDGRVHVRRGDEQNTSGLKQSVGAGKRRPGKRQMFQDVSQRDDVKGVWLVES